MARLRIRRKQQPTSESKSWHVINFNHRAMTLARHAKENTSPRVNSYLSPMDYYFFRIIIFRIFVKKNHPNNIS